MSTASKTAMSLLIILYKKKRKQALHFSDVIFCNFPDNKVLVIFVTIHEQKF